MRLLHALSVDLTSGLFAFFPSCLFLVMATRSSVESKSVIQVDRLSSTGKAGNVRTGLSNGVSIQVFGYIEIS
jgi:hypothetical protein